MPANAWQVGAVYDPKYNSVAWSQPGGPGTQVFPAQVTGGFDLLSNVPFNERTGQYTGTCQHSFNECAVFRDYDYTNNVSVALLCCPVCSCVQRTLEPYEAALTTQGSLINVILYP
jgi:hypothetical protein